MKQLLLAAGCALAGFSALAQTPAVEFKATEKLTVAQPGLRQAQNQYDRVSNRRVDVIDEIDFSTGLPDGWSTYGDVEGIPNADAVWEYRGPNTTPDNTTGSIGSCAGANGAIESETVDNGFMIFDSNNLDDPSDACGGNIGSGVAPVPHSGFLETAPYDLSTFSSITVSWTQSARFLGGLLEVEVSTDGGATWEKTGYAANNEYEVNEATPADAFAAVDVTDLAAGEADVRFRFAWSPNFGANVAALGYYFWQIDDVSITTTADFDAGYTHSLQYMDADGTYYGSLPLSESRPYTAELGYRNLGASEITVSSNVTALLDQSELAADISVDDISIAPGQFSDTTVNEIFTPDAIGDYEVTYEAVVAEGADELTYNNELTDRFVVTEDIMSHATPNSAVRRVIGAGTSFTPEQGGDDDVYLGSYFTLNNDKELTNIRVPLGNATLPGAIYRLYIASGDLVNVGDGTGLPSSLDNIAFEISPNLIVTEEDTTAGELNLPLSLERLPLAAGSYFVCVRLSSSAGQFPIDIVDDQENDRFGLASILGLADVWYTNGNALEIFLTVEDPSDDAVNTIANSTFTVSPNPAVNNANIAFEGATGDYSVAIRNIQGQVVFNETVAANGSFNLNVNTSNFSNGVYVVELRGENGLATQQLVIRK